MKNQLKPKEMYYVTFKTLQNLSKTNENQSKAWKTNQNLRKYIILHSKSYKTLVKPMQTNPKHEKPIKT